MCARAGVRGALKCALRCLVGEEAELVPPVPGGGGGRCRRDCVRALLVDAAVGRTQRYLDNGH